ncbi:MAG: Transcription-repair coupling factor, partial [Parcubacteria group bacterium GW2011_GWA2_48_9]
TVQVQVPSLTSRNLEVRREGTVEVECDFAARRRNEGFVAVQDVTVLVTKRERVCAVVVVACVACDLDDQETYISGSPSRSAQTFVIAKLPFLKDQGAFFWLTANEKEEEVISQLLSYWRPDLPILHGNESMRPDQLLILLRNEPFFFIVPAERTHEPLPHPDELLNSLIQYEKGAATSPSDVAQELVKRGYEWNVVADTHGTYSRRGGIIDVYPLGAKGPVRIECDERSIVVISSIDPLSKKTGAPIPSLEIPPAKLHSSYRADAWMYLKRATHPYVILDSPDELAERVPEWDETYEQVRQHKQIIWESFKTRQRDIDMRFKRSPLYYNRLNTLAQDLVKLQNEQTTIYIASNKEKELRVLFEEKKISKRISFLPEPPSSFTGFANEEQRFQILTNIEIFGNTETSNGLPKRVEMAFITELRPGDYVVHIDHGIARFRGMTKNVVEGISKEYFVLEYAENDKLYVPIETAEKISKYIGLANPKLHRLSGGQWYQITRKIKEEAKLLAHDLLKLYARRAASKTTVMGSKTKEEHALDQSFPYEETPDQLQAIVDVDKDLTRTKPMDRLICGDVGFGKTEVAIRAALKAVMNRTQVALLSPTTILTQQHFDTFTERLKNLPAKVAILSRFVSEKEERETVARITAGDVDIVIGTHRLLSPDITFKNLGLIIIDEEQRFGVQHKERLKTLRTQAHILTLTATPIPRTLNIALSGIRDVSIIETPPEGRLPIETIIERHDTNLIVRAIRQELERKGQVYYLYNNVETIDFAARELNKLIPEARIGVAHGKLSERLLSQAMRDFDTKKTDILVCSTIIENGLDLPNVNTLIVENATKFGLAQLYQLRGRIGRGVRQAYAYFLYDRKKLTGTAKRRLHALLEAKELGSGFQLALRDLEIRGTGNILGKEQHGKVSAIGLAMYTRLLSQAVKELKTGAIETIRDVTIDLPVEIGIPKTFMPAEGERLVMYQKIANLSSPDELSVFKKRVTYRQKIPKSFENLFDVLEIKLIAQKTDIVTIDTVSIPGPTPDKHKRIIITFAHHLDTKKLGQLLERNSHWQFTQNQIKIDLETLGDAWLQVLKEEIRLWQLERQTTAVHEKKAART